MFGLLRSQCSPKMYIAAHLHDEVFGQMSMRGLTKCMLQSRSLGELAESVINKTIAVDEETNFTILARKWWVIFTILHY